MSDKNQPIDIQRELLLKDLFCNSQDKKLFKILDKQLTQQRFTNISLLSANEDILNMNASNMTIDNIKDIITKFLNIKKISSVYSNRSLYELVKISNLPQQKLNKLISSQSILSLCNKLTAVSHETKYISYDFMVLRIATNILVKITDLTNRNKFILLKKEICHNLVTKEYLPEEKNKPNTYLCWIDMLLNLTIFGDLSVDKYIAICNKVANLTSFDSDILWKISSASSYLLQDPYFCDATNLRNFRRNILNKATLKNNVYECNKQEITNLLIKTLAKDVIYNEDYYCMFNKILGFSQNSADNKLYCLNIFHYFFYRHTIKHYFSYRHIRESFLNTLFKIIDSESNIEINESSFIFICKLLLDKENFELHFNDLFNKATYLLKKISDAYTDITPQQFYKYCNILDYIEKRNNIQTELSLSEILANSYREPKLIKKHLKRSMFKYGV